MPDTSAHENFRRYTSVLRVWTTLCHVDLSNMYGYVPFTIHSPFTIFTSHQPCFICYLSSSCTFLSGVGQALTSGPLAGAGRAPRAAAPSRAGYAGGVGSTRGVQQCPYVELSFCMHVINSQDYARSMINAGISVHFPVSVTSIRKDTRRGTQLPQGIVLLDIWFLTFNALFCHTLAVVQSCVPRHTKCNRCTHLCVRHFLFRTPPRLVSIVLRDRLQILHTQYHFTNTCPWPPMGSARRAHAGQPRPRANKALGRPGFQLTRGLGWFPYTTGNALPSGQAVIGAYGPDDSYTGTLHTQRWNLLLEARLQCAGAHDTANGDLCLLGGPLPHAL